MKRTLLLTIMALTVATLSWAQAVRTINSVNYRATGVKTASVCRSEKASGEVIIRKKVKIDGVERTVTAIDDNAFLNCKKMTEVHIPITVTSFGKSAFYGCDGLKEVFLEKGGHELWINGKIKFADKYSNPIFYTKGFKEIVSIKEKVYSTVTFTKPTIILDDGTTLTPSSAISDSSKRETILPPAPKGEKKSLVRFNTRWFELDSHFDVPESQEAQQYLAELLFGETGIGFQEAYSNFLKSWEQEERHISVPIGRISISINKEYEQEGRFACYHVQASVKGSAKLTDLPNTQKAEKQKAQYFKLVKGIDNRFIVDTKEQKIAGIDQIFLPEIAEKIKKVFGDEISLYAEDRCLQLVSQKGDGRFIFNKSSENNFTDYFKNLVGWNELKDIDTPSYLHGQKGLEDFLKKSKFNLADDDDKEVEIIKMSMVIFEDGNHSQPTVEDKSIYFDEKELLEVLEKMPKWQPAYKDGMPISKEVMFSIRVPRWLGKPDQMPEYPGGSAALTRFINEELKYPPVCEENGIQGRVICTFIVEEDGSISNLAVRKSVDPALDREAIRVLSRMPKWKPGIQKGKAVRVKYTVPVTFRLN